MAENDGKKAGSKVAADTVQSSSAGLVRATRGKREFIVPSLNDDAELMEKKALMSRLAFKVTVPNKTTGEPEEFYVYPDANNDGELTRDEIHAILEHPMLQGRIPEAKLAELQAMADAGNNAAIISGDKSAPAAAFQPAVTFTIPRFEAIPGERIASARARWELLERGYVEGKGTEETGKRFVRIDNNNDGNVLVSEIRNLRQFPGIKEQLTEEGMWRLINWEIRATRVFTVEMLDSYIKAKKEVLNWPSDIREEVTPLLDGSGFIDKETQKRVVANLEQRQAEFISSQPPAVQEIFARRNRDLSVSGIGYDTVEAAGAASRQNRKCFLGYPATMIGTQMYRFAHEIDVLAIKRVITPEQKEEILSKVAAYDQAKTMVIFEGNLQERLDAPLPETVMNYAYMEKSKRVGVTYANANKPVPTSPEAVSRFEVPASAPSDFAPNIKTTPKNGKDEPVLSREQELAVREFERSVQIPVKTESQGRAVTVMYNLDADGNKVLDKSEVQRVLASANVDNMITPETKLALQKMLASEGTVINSAALMEEKIKALAPEERMALEAFDNMTMVTYNSIAASGVVMKHQLNLDTNCDGVLTNLEASRNLNDPHVQRYLGAEQKEALRSMVNLGVEIVESKARLQEHYSTPIVSGSTKEGDQPLSEETKQFIQARDVNDGKVNIGEALRFNEKQKSLATAQVVRP